VLVCVIMTSVTDVNKPKPRHSTQPSTPSSLPLARRAKDRRVRAASAGSTDVQLLTNVRDVSLIQASDSRRFAGVRPNSERYDGSPPPHNDNITYGTDHAEFTDHFIVVTYSCQDAQN